MPNFISEDDVEKALVQKLQHLPGFDALECHTEDPADLHGGSGRADKRDVILLDRVRTAAQRLNPELPAKVIDTALERLMDRQQALALEKADQHRARSRDLLLPRLISGKLSVENLDIQFPSSMTDCEIEKA